MRLLLSHYSLYLLISLKRNPLWNRAIYLVHDLLVKSLFIVFELTDDLLSLQIELISRIKLCL